MIYTCYSVENLDKVYFTPYCNVVMCKEGVEFYHLITNEVIRLDAPHNVIMMLINNFQYGIKQPVLMTMLSSLSIDADNFLKKMKGCELIE